MLISMDTGHDTKTNNSLVFFLESICLFLCPHLNLSFLERRIICPAETNSVGTWNSAWESCFSLLAATSSAAEVRTQFVPSCPYSPREISSCLNLVTVWQILMSSRSLVNTWTQQPVPPHCPVCWLRSAFSWSLVGRHYFLSAFIVRTQRWSEVFCSFVSFIFMTHEYP